MDDYDLKDLDPSEWRRIIGTVGQEPVLFSTTIRNNITYGCSHPKKITDDDVRVFILGSIYHILGSILFPIKTITSKIKPFFVKKN